jgi:hypothetical protein
MSTFPGERFECGIIYLLYRWSAKDGNDSAV